MAIDLQALRTKIEQLASEADQLVQETDPNKLPRLYQSWYSQVHHIVRIQHPSRLEDLERLYSVNPEASAMSFGTRGLYYGMQTYVQDADPDHRPAFVSGLEQQRGILLAVPNIIVLRVLEVAALVTADLVQGELAQATLLLESGFIRAAGAVAGVALEAHLKLLHDQSSPPLAYGDKDTIVPLATRLRKAGVISLGAEKQCIAMADTRNTCDHKKKQDPTEEEVQELIDDVDRFTKRVQVI